LQHRKFSVQLPTDLRVTFNSSSEAPPRPHCPPTDFLPTLMILCHLLDHGYRWESLWGVQGGGRDLFGWLLSPKNGTCRPQTALPFPNLNTRIANGKMNSANDPTLGYAVLTHKHQSSYIDAYVSLGPWLGSGLLGPWLGPISQASSNHSLSVSTHAR